LGNVKSDAGEFEKARAYYLEAIDLLEPLNNQRALGIVYSNLALQEASTHQLEAAIHHFKQALDLHRAVGDEQGLANTYSQLGKTFFLVGEWFQKVDGFQVVGPGFFKFPGIRFDVSQIDEGFPDRIGILVSPLDIEHFSIAPFRFGVFT